MSKVISPPFLEPLGKLLESSPQFIQVVLGPRQVGKTTGILQLLDQHKSKAAYYSSDEELSPTGRWLEEKWQDTVSQTPNAILAIDEIQRVPQWSSTIKKLWDRQARKKDSNLKLVLLGSSSLQIRDGLEESLSGRFQLTRATHWGFKKSCQLRTFDPETFIRAGGYPGSYPLLDQPKEWEHYIRDSIIETVIGKDILQLARVRKPALFRQTFAIASGYPAQEISYTKLLGQLQDSGNTDLVKYYLELLEGAFLIKSLPKYSAKASVKRASSPKLVPLCGALIDRACFQNKESYGRAFESAVGACLLNHGFELSYWREGNAEVDYILADSGDLFAIEVKSGRPRSSKGMDTFLKIHKKAKPLYITSSSIEKFLINPAEFLEKFR